MRPVSIEAGVNRHAEGSCLVAFGDTRVICTASVEERVPSFLRNSRRGWITAEYGMLPRATHTRTGREAALGKQGGRTIEIQRLIGRSLRTATDLTAFGERQIRLDCDVLQADGGTRAAAVTGAWVALHQAFTMMVRAGAIGAMPLRTQIAAVSCGVYRDREVLDLDYAEDSEAETDANFVMTASGALIEMQGTAEREPMARDRLLRLLDLAETGIATLVRVQNQALPTHAGQN